jgi:hypothetical protein
MMNNDDPWWMLIIHDEYWRGVVGMLWVCGVCDKRIIIVHHDNSSRCIMMTHHDAARLVMWRFITMHHDVASWCIMMIRRDASWLLITAHHDESSCSVVMIHHDASDWIVTMNHHDAPCWSVTMYHDELLPCIVVISPPPSTERGVPSWWPTAPNPYIYIYSKYLRASPPAAGPLSTS